MALTVGSLLKYTLDAQKPMSVGVHYSAGDADEGWGVVPEVKDGQQTGRIGVICDDNKVRKDFIKVVRKLGHIVEIPLLRRPRNTVFVILKVR